jgi:ubiquinone/menaquinone biosynthesis C-methylase UbiE
MTTRKSISAREGYDRWAPSYDQSPNPVVAMDEIVLGRRIAEMADQISGQVVIDAGCGTGRHTLRLARAAARVIAMDFSSQMLSRVADKVRAQGLADKVELIEHDLHQPVPLEREVAGGVLCSLVGEHLSDLHVVFAELARVTRPGGWLIFSVYHPILALAGKEANFADADTGVEYRLGAIKHLSAEYVNAMIGAGFTLERMGEHGADPAIAERIPGAERYGETPLLLVLEGTRRDRSDRARRRAQ